MFCPEIITLKYSNTIKSRYDNFSHLKGFALLESPENGVGRYDIVTALPYNSLHIPSGTTHVKDAAKQLLESIESLSSDYSFPFQGGAIGYFSYDLGAAIHGIAATSQPTLESMPLMDIGLYDWAFIVDHQKQTAHYFAANRDPATANQTRELLALWDSSVITKNTFSIQSDLITLISKEQYSQAFETIMEDIKKGRCYQVNYTQPFHIHYEGDPWQIYKAISQQNPVPFSAFLRTEYADVLSFSPERFLSYAEGRLLSSPIKGSIGRSDDSKTDDYLKHQLMSSQKNRAENVMIVDLIRNDLGKISLPGSVKVDRLFDLQSFPAVHHLVSDVSATLDSDKTPTEALLSCFPAGSITGAPKVEAMKVISEVEPYGRGIYCGAIGYISNHGQFDTNVAIRTMTAREGTLHLAAGGGIVIDSDCEDEYRECFTKIQAIMNAIKRSNT